MKASSLWDDESLRKKVLGEALPPPLVDRLGMDTILERVPSNYLRAIFARHLATKYVYANGTEASPFAFFQFMQSYND